MRTNKFSLKRSIGVHASSMGNWGHQDHFKPVYVFTKRFQMPQNTYKQKQTNKTKISA